MTDSDDQLPMANVDTLLMRRLHAEREAALAGSAAALGLAGRAEAERDAWKARAEAAEKRVEASG